MHPYFQNAHGELYHGDCLEVMEWLPTRYAPFDMVLTDPPYGTTACKWDAVIPFEPMWRGAWCSCTESAAVVLTAGQPFTSNLVCSCLGRYRYDWTWVKSKPVGHLRAKKQPMRNHEDILVFSRNPPRYFPQGLSPIPPRLIKRTNTGGNYGRQAGEPSVQKATGYPRTAISFGVQEGLHPTQKPVGLFSYLIKTYTHPGETVLDFCAGSGTTAVAAQETGRRWVMIEKEEKYCEIIANRLEGLCWPQKGGACTDAGRGCRGNSVTTHAKSAR